MKSSAARRVSKVLGLEPDSRRPEVKRAAKAQKGMWELYGEGKI
jgi:hypothetical protein